MNTATPAKTNGSSSKTKGRGAPPSSRKDQVSQTLAAMRSENEVLLKNLQREALYRQQQDDHLKEVRVAHARQLTFLNEQLQEASKAHGSNTISKKNFTTYDHATNDNLKNFIKFQMMPHHKFWHSSWSKFAPDDPYSFYCKVQDEFAIPEDAVRCVYWRDKQVPQVSKKVTDWRSNATKHSRTAYYGKW